MTVDFYKYHALGNDYIILDPNKTALPLTAETIRLLCHRHFGIGSDGILYGPFFQEDGIHLRILNPDGSEAEKSGNGIRMFARYLFDAGYLKDSSFDLFTPGGKVSVEILDARASLIKVNMGTATFSSTAIPVAGPDREVVAEPLSVLGCSYAITCLSVGNPHCVIPLPDISRELAEQLGPVIENHPLFPHRINLQLLKVLDRSTIQIEIWERGAGYTLASGSSSCAAASAAYRLGLIDRNVTVIMPGGTLRIALTITGDIYMTGPVTSVYQGTLSETLLSRS